MTLCWAAQRAGANTDDVALILGAIIRNAILLALLASPALASSTVDMEEMMEHVAIAAKLLMVFSAIIGIALILMFSRESDEEEERKRGIKCAKS